MINLRRTKKVTIRLTPSEFKQLEHERSKCKYYQNMSEYVRRRLFTDD